MFLQIAFLFVFQVGSSDLLALSEIANNDEAHEGQQQLTTEERTEVCTVVETRLTLIATVWRVLSHSIRVPTQVLKVL